MVKYTRPPIRRLQVIHHRLKEGGYPNTVGLSEELEVNRRTILRDIEYLRDQLGAPVEYCGSRKGFYYSDTSYAIPAVHITEGDLIAIFVAEKALALYRGTPYETALKTAFERIAGSLPDEVRVSLSGIEQAYSFRLTAQSEQDLEIFKCVAGAAIKRRQIRMEYYTLYRDAVGSRVVDPYQLLNFNGDWYLFAYCHSRQEMRTFLVSRIKSVEKTGRGFTRDESLDVAGALGHSFGIITGDEKHTVRLKFDEFAARYIREKVWHPSQTIKQGKDGALTLTLKLNSLVEIRWWILSWGEHVEVLGPAELRTSLAETAALCAKRYRRSRKVPGR